MKTLKTTSRQSFLFPHNESVTQVLTVCGHRREICYIVCHSLLICKQYAFVIEGNFRKNYSKSFDLGFLSFTRPLFSLHTAYLSGDTRKPTQFLNVIFPNIPNTPYTSMFGEFSPFASKIRPNENIIVCIARKGCSKVGHLIFRYVDI